MQGLKRPARVADHSPTSTVDVKGMNGPMYPSFTLPTCLRAVQQDTFTFHLTRCRYTSVHASHGDTCVAFRLLSGSHFCPLTLQCPLKCVPFALSRTALSGLLFGTVRSICSCWFHHAVYFTAMTCVSCVSWLWCMLIPLISSRRLKCTHTHTRALCRLINCSFANIGHACSLSYCHTVDSLHVLPVSVSNILFVTSDLVLLLIHFQSLLSDLPSTANRNVSSSPVICLSILLTYHPCTALLSHFFMGLNLLSWVARLPFFVPHF